MSGWRSGDHVVIRFNPHHRGADGLVGSVVGPAQDERARGLIDVRYVNPADGQEYVRPFGAVNLGASDRAELLVAAERHEHIARELRSLASRGERDD